MGKIGNYIEGVLSCCTYEEANNSKVNPEKTNLCMVWLLWVWMIPLSSCFNSIPRKTVYSDINVFINAHTYTCINKTDRNHFIIDLKLGNILWFEAKSIWDFEIVITIDVVRWLLTAIKILNFGCFKMKSTAVVSRMSNGSPFRSRCVYLRFLVGFVRLIGSFFCVMICRSCSSFCPFSFGHCVVCSSIYGIWLPLWYPQTFLSVESEEFQMDNHGQLIKMSLKIPKG